MKGWVDCSVEEKIERVPARFNLLEGTLRAYSFLLITAFSAFFIYFSNREASRNFVENVKAGGWWWLIPSVSLIVCFWIYIGVQEKLRQDKKGIEECENGKKMQ